MARKVSETFDNHTEKERIRHTMRAKRRSLSNDQIALYSAKINSKLEKLPEYREAGSLCAYVPFDKEVDTLPLIERTLGSKQVVLTRVISSIELELREIRSLDDLEIGAFGIHEPNNTCPIVEPKSIDLFIVPGLAFDEDKHRLGFGAGFFDRMLATLSARLIGLAYSFQIVPKLPSEEHDIAMDFVLTEKD